MKGLGSACMALALAAACTASAAVARLGRSWWPDMQTITALEAQARTRLPAGAAPLERYDRSYAGVWISGRRMVEGVYWKVPDEPYRDGRPPPLPAIHIVAPDKLPFSSDGGCDTVTVIYDMATAKFAGAFCNGVA